MGAVQRLTAEDFQRAAEAIGTDVPAIRAVVAVESSGSGFLPDGRPKILFEAHWFARFTGGRYNRSHPHISSARWNRRLYRGGALEHDRLQEARSLNSQAALKSASWGLFQIMGFNFAQAGFDNVDRFVEAMHVSEGRHLDAFVHFIQAKNLGRFLVEHDWDAFAYRYNGAGYRQNRYDEKLAAAHAQYSRETITPPRAPATGPETYAVRRGDTLAAIAKRFFKGNLGALLRANPDIKNPNLIQVGQRIKLA